MTAVPPVLAQGVDFREGYRCLRCGRSLSDPPVGGFSRHHRQRRAVGLHTYSNLILLCGSGTTGCHGWAHANPNKARRDGLIIDANRRPPIETAEVPVLTWQGWRVLDNNGQSTPIIEALALELLAAFGLLRGDAA